MLFHLDMKIVNLIHVFVIGMLLCYIGYFKNPSKAAFYLLAISALCIPILVPFDIDLTSSVYWNSIKAMHYFILLPILLYIAYNGIYHELSKNTNNVLLFTGLVVVSYHLYRYLYA